MSSCVLSSSSRLVGLSCEVLWFVYDILWLWFGLLLLFKKLHLLGMHFNQRTPDNLNGATGTKPITQQPSN